MGPTTRRTMRSLVGATCSYALGGALGLGLGAGSYAFLTGDAEYNDAAGLFLLFGAGVGATLLGTVGAVLGLVHALTGWWIRRPWILPLVGLGIGALLTVSEVDAALPRAAVVGWPICGLVAGGLIEILFRAWVHPN